MRSERRLRDLPLPVPFTVGAFAERLADRRGRPIVLRPSDRLPGVSGLWIPGPTEDVIVYHGGAVGLHQQQIVLHELCHLWCGHRPPSILDLDAQHGVFLLISPDNVDQVLGRSGYSTEEEREAEVLATLILERAASAAREQAQDVLEGMAPGLQRFVPLLQGENPLSP